MAIYICEKCGFVYNENIEVTPWEQYPNDWKCPVCNNAKANFQKYTKAPNKEGENETNDMVFTHDCKAIETTIDMIQEMAIHGRSRMEVMCTPRPVIGWNDILILGAQLYRSPLPEDVEVDSTTIIGAKAKKPMILEQAVYVSHMSYGALSKEAKMALALGSSRAHTAQCSGEGKILLEEREHAYKFIFEYVPNEYSVSDENLKNSDAIEIKIGQGAHPGMGSYLPGARVNEDIASVRGKPLGEDSMFPPKFSQIRMKDDLKALVEDLRTRSEGRPIGIKIAAGHIEQDLSWINYANPDFITIDARGGATSASFNFLKDNTSMPTIYALARARSYMDRHGMKQELVMTGGFRTSGEVIKALAMGANAVAIASAALIAMGCQQDHLCNSGKCPHGIVTQDPALRKNFSIEEGAKRLENYLHTLNEELKTFARITGRLSIHKLNIDDLCTTNNEISECTTIKHC